MRNSQPFFASSSRSAVFGPEFARQSALPSADAMLVLFETPAGLALFDADEKKLKKVDNIDTHFLTADAASEV